MIWFVGFLLWPLSLTLQYWHCHFTSWHHVPSASLNTNKVTFTLDSNLKWYVKPTEAVRQKVMAKFIVYTRCNVTATQQSRSTEWQWWLLQRVSLAAKLVIFRRHSQAGTIIMGAGILSGCKILRLLSNCGFLCTHLRSQYCRDIAVPCPSMWYPRRRDPPWRIFD